MSVLLDWEPETCPDRAILAIDFWVMHRHASDIFLREGLERYVRPLAGIDVESIRQASRPGRGGMTTLQMFAYWLLSGMFGARYTQDEVKVMLVDEHGLQGNVLISQALRSAPPVLQD